MKRNPTENEKRSLIGLLAASAVEVVMKNHFYTIGDEIRRQTEGGSIGSDLTGEAARLYMLQWDKAFLDILKITGLKLDLYSRYVDDMVLVTRAIGKGWYWDKSKKLKWSVDKYNLDKDVSDDEITAKVLSDIANSINTNIQTTTDLPSRNPSQRMPVLDLHMWISRKEGVPIVTYSFYKKEVASRFTIMKRSAINSGTKKSTIFQEGLRRLQNISPWLPWKESVLHMSKWSLCLKESGYSPKERYDAIRGACMRHEEIKRKVLEGEIPGLNRTRQEILRMKEEKGGLSSSTWFLKGKVANTIKCQATPNGELAKNLSRRNFSSNTFILQMPGHSQWGVGQEPHQELKQTGRSK